MSEKATQLNGALEDRERQLKLLQRGSDSITSQAQLGRQLYNELKAQYPQLKDAVLQPATILRDSAQQSAYLVILTMPGRMSNTDKIKLSNQLKIRLKQDSVALILRP